MSLNMPTFRGEIVQQTMRLHLCSGDLITQPAGMITLRGHGYWSPLTNEMASAKPVPEPANTGTNVGLMLGQRLRRWPNINPTLPPVFTGQPIARPYQPVFTLSAGFLCDSPCERKLKRHGRKTFYQVIGWLSEEGHFTSLLLLIEYKLY